MYGLHIGGEDVCARTWIGPWANHCLNILAFGWSLSVRLRSNPRLFPNCTKGDLRLPSRVMPGFVLWISAQLVAIDSNRRLSQIVRNLVTVQHS